MPNVTEIYASLVDDPDLIPPEDVSKEDYALLLAQQRVKQHENNEKALNLGLTKLLKYTNGHSTDTVVATNGHTSAVDNLSDFLFKADGINKAARRILEDLGHSDASIDEIVEGLGTDKVPVGRGGKAMVNETNLRAHIDKLNDGLAPTDEQRVTPGDHMIRMANRKIQEAREIEKGNLEEDAVFNAYKTRFAIASGGLRDGVPEVTESTALEGQDNFAGKTGFRAAQAYVASQGQDINATDPTEKLNARKSYLKALTAMYAQRATAKNIVMAGNSMPNLAFVHNNLTSSHRIAVGPTVAKNAFAREMVEHMRAAQTSERQPVASTVPPPQGTERPPLPEGAAKAALETLYGDDYEDKFKNGDFHEPDTGAPLTEEALEAMHDDEQERQRAAAPISETEAINESEIDSETDSEADTEAEASTDSETAPVVGPVADSVADSEAEASTEVDPADFDPSREFQGTNAAKQAFVAHFGGEDAFNTALAEGRLDPPDNVRQWTKRAAVNHIKTLPVPVETTDETVASDGTEAESDSDDAETPDQIHARMTADMTGYATGELKRLFTDDGFKEFTNKVNAIDGDGGKLTFTVPARAATTGGREEIQEHQQEVKSLDDAQAYIKELRNNSEHPHAGIKDEMLANPAYKNFIETEFADPIYDDASVDDEEGGEGGTAAAGAAGEDQSSSGEESIDPALTKIKEIIDRVNDGTLTDDLNEEDHELFMEHLVNKMTDTNYQKKWDESFPEYETGAENQFYSNNAEKIETKLKARAPVDDEEGGTAAGTAAGTSEEQQGEGSGNWPEPTDETTRVTEDDSKLRFHTNAGIDTAKQYGLMHPNGTYTDLGHKFLDQIGDLHTTATDQMLGSAKDRTTDYVLSKQNQAIEQRNDRAMTKWNEESPDDRGEQPSPTEKKEKYTLNEGALKKKTLTQSTFISLVKALNNPEGDGEHASHDWTPSYDPNTGLLKTGELRPASSRTGASQVNHSPNVPFNLDHFNYEGNGDKKFIHSLFANLIADDLGIVNHEAAWVAHMIKAAGGTDEDASKGAKIIWGAGTFEDDEGDITGNPETITEDTYKNVEREFETSDNVKKPIIGNGNTPDLETMVSEMVDIDFTAATAIDPLSPRAGLSPEAHVREDRIKDLKEVMHKDSHKHLDDPTAYTDKDIDKLWEKEVRDRTMIRAEDGTGTAATGRSKGAGQADKRAKQVAALKPVMEDAAHEHLDDPDGLTDDAIDKLYHEHIRKPALKPKKETDLFNKKKAIALLAKLTNPEADEAEIADDIKSLEARYDPAIGADADSKDLKDALSKIQNLKGNERAQAVTAKKNALKTHTLVTAQNELSNFQSPSDYIDDKVGNPRGEKMSEEDATMNAKNLFDHWHKNLGAFSDTSELGTENQRQIKAKLQEYVDAGADQEDILKDSNEMKRLGILGDPEKMAAFRQTQADEIEESRKKQEIDAKTEESRGVSHRTKLEQAIKNAHADRSTDADGNPVHHRLDDQGNPKAVSPEDAGIEHTDADTPHLGHIDPTTGELDDKAQELYHDLHEAKKLQPHDEAKLGHQTADSDHHDRLSELAGLRQDQFEDVEDRKEQSHRKNDAELEASNQRKANESSARLKEMQGWHQLGVEEDDRSAKARLDSLESLRNEHNEILSTHATQTSAIHIAHAARRHNLNAQGQENLQGIDKEARELSTKIKEEELSSIGEQIRQRDAKLAELKVRQDKEVAPHDKKIKENRDTIQAIDDVFEQANTDANKATQTSQDVYDAAIEAGGLDAASLVQHPQLVEKLAEIKKLKTAHETELEGINATLEEARTTHNQNLRNPNGWAERFEEDKEKALAPYAKEADEINTVHDQDREQLVADAAKASGEITDRRDTLRKNEQDTVTNMIKVSEGRRDQALGEIDTVKQTAEEGLIGGFNKRREERGEPPLLRTSLKEPIIPAMGVKQLLDQEQSRNIDTADGKRKARESDHTKEVQDLTDETREDTSLREEEHQSNAEGIDEESKREHTANDEAHNATVIDSHKKKERDHIYADTRRNVSPGLEAPEKTQAAQKALEDHMRKGGATEEEIARASKNPNLGKNAAGTEIDHEEEKNHGDPDYTDREGKPQQTRMVDDPTVEGEKKQQIWVPGRGKGWVDKDKMDSATSANMKASGGAGGKMLIYPAGSAENPFETAMAGHGGNFHSIETDNPLASDHPDAAGHDHEDVIAHHLGNHLNDHPGMAGTEAFSIDANEVGFGDSPHGAVSPKQSKKESLQSNFGGEAAQARAADPASQVGVKQVVQGFTSAMDWLNQKASGNESVQKFKAGIGEVTSDLRRDINRSGGLNPLNTLAEGMRTSRIARERLVGKKYPRSGILDPGFGPNTEGKANLSREWWRLSPFKPEEVKVAIADEDKKDQGSAVRNLSEHMTKIRRGIAEDDRKRGN